MQVFYDVKQAAKFCSNCALAIGNFDGYHLGHRSVVEQLKSLAKSQNLDTAVMIFNPHPKSFFKGDQYQTIASLTETIAGFTSVDIDYLICLTFDEKLANVSANDFVENLLIKKLNIKGIVVGEDFKYGKARQGELQTLSTMAQKYNIPVIGCESYLVNKVRVSSSLIKQLLAEGKVEQANELLVNPYSITGVVVDGDKRGTQWGFPTANIQVDKSMLLPYGIYVVEVLRDQKNTYPGVASYGIRPTVSVQDFGQLEVHLLDVRINCYHEFMTIRFLHRLRDEKKFSNIENLIKQIAQDCNDSREFFKNK